MLSHGPRQPNRGWDSGVRAEAIKTNRLYNNKVLLSICRAELRCELSELYELSLTQLHAHYTEMAAAPVTSIVHLLPPSPGCDFCRELRNLAAAP